MRVRSILEFIGLVSPPPPPPAKRRPTARPAVKPATRPQVTPTQRPAVQPARPEPEPIPERGRAEPGLPPYAQAVGTWIRQWGKNGTVPRADAVALAERRLGKDLAAYLTALRLIDGQLTKYVLPASRINDVAATVGLMKHLEKVVYSDLDTWASAEKIDLKNREAAEWAGRPVPDALHIPNAVQVALVARMNAAAQALIKGGKGGKSGGGVRPAPDTDIAVQALAELSDEPAYQRSPLPGSKKPDDEEQAEETATGKPLAEPRGAPPDPEDGEPDAEGGGPATPRF